MITISFISIVSIKRKWSTSTDHLLIVVTAIVVAVAVLAAVTLGRITGHYHWVTLTLAAHTLAARRTSARQTVVRPSNIITW